MFKRQQAREEQGSEKGTGRRVKKEENSRPIFERRGKTSNDGIYVEVVERERHPSYLPIKVEV